MNLHMFSNIKSKGELQKVSIPTSGASHPEDKWSTGEQDALHIPILGSGGSAEAANCAYSPDLLNPFGVDTSDASHEVKVIPVQEKELLLEQDQAHLPLLEVEVEAESLPLIGVYAESPEYVDSLRRELERFTDIPMHCFDSSTSKEALSSNNKITLWIINLSDDDEGELLDEVLDASTECQTLYLSGGLSKHCKNKIWDFVHESEGEVLHS